MPVPWQFGEVRIIVDKAFKLAVPCKVGLNQITHGIRASTENDGETRRRHA